MNILHGNILFSKSYDELVTYEDSYLIVENGKEMCIRDRCIDAHGMSAAHIGAKGNVHAVAVKGGNAHDSGNDVGGCIRAVNGCLLYTSEP